ncbi:MAG: phosphoglycerate kinase, partial [Clostridiales bacterium]
IIGGAKISDKIAVIENLLIKVDKLLIGGGMANTFLAAQGYNMQKSLVESAKIEWAKELLTFPAAKEKLILPVDLLAAAEFSNDAEFKQVTVDKIPENWQALDIGMKTISLFQDEIMKAATIVWNGPLGVFEMDNFDQGTIRVAKAVAASEGFSIIGGGDSVAAINKAGLEDKIDHISTGGGASLKVLEGKILPGLDALDDISQ